MIRQTRLDRFLARFETIGNSISFYILLLIVILGIWILTPFAPDWRPNGKVFGITAMVFAIFTMLHGILWFFLTRDYIKMPKKARASLTMTVRILRPLHMMSGLFALGIVLIHAYAFVKTGYGWNRYSISGALSLLTLSILAIDGIGLMSSPFLSRVVHRWIAVLFTALLAIHLWYVL
ncbi:hypothetical protein [Effusibacillus dendaii]|uniref:Ferric oxidoreductase domain-containing protein n=1 Tax=Effusibacillus dendaii TaxID=2743772 RepID=A0A7I8DBP5_9BACL|nr:hypothetical protein [Effusibacillus dendaii]BCJ86379.1 hypothetical protein skT53_13640 [Effusibacillus dendaii]